MSGVWNDDAITALKKHFEAGLSCSQIAGQIHADTGQSFSRNAVIGKLHRLGISNQKPKAQPKSAAVRRPPRKSVNSLHVIDRALPPPATAAEAQARAKEMAAAQPVMDLAPRNIPFLDRCRDECAFICSAEGEPVTVCGHATISYQHRGVTTASSYCRTHHRFTHCGFGEDRRRKAA